MEESGKGPAKGKKKVRKTNIPVDEGTPKTPRY